MVLDYCLNQPKCILNHRLGEKIYQNPRLVKELENNIVFPYIQNVRYAN